MSILLVTLNHHTAPVELRERLALPQDELAFALAGLAGRRETYTGDPALATGDLPPVLREGVILSTCNRLEIYAAAHEIGAGKAAIENFISRLEGIPPSELKPHLTFMHDQAAVLHLMRVAAGLDSMVLGEPQILGQVADALAAATEAGAAGPLLAQLFEQAIRAGKRARAETAISQHTTSVSHAAALLAQQQTGDVGAADVLLLGAGEMAKVAGLALADRGARHITCLNRTLDTARTLAGRLGGSALPWHHLPGALAAADVVISATGAPHTLVHADDVQAILPAREGRPLVIVDIGLPRNVEAAVGALPGVHLFDIDDLQHVLDANVAQREAAIPHVEHIIAEEAAAFAGWISSRQVVPVIADLHQWAGEVAQAEVERALNKLGEATPREQEVVEWLAHRLVNKLLHPPTMTLRQQAAQGNGYGYGHVARELFDLRESQYRPNRAAKANGNGYRPTPALCGEAADGD